VTRYPTLASEDDQLRWQVRSTYLMLDLLHRGQRASLPPVTWTVGDADARLLIRCYTRPEWEAWVEASGVGDIRPEQPLAGYWQLRALGDVATPDGGRVRVVVIADLYLDDETAMLQVPLKRAS
jgi:hypothetical protein